MKAALKAKQEMEAEEAARREQQVELKEQYKTNIEAWKNKNKVCPDGFGAKHCAAWVWVGVSARPLVYPQGRAAKQALPVCHPRCNAVTPSTFMPPHGLRHCAPPQPINLAANAPSVVQRNIHVSPPPTARAQGNIRGLLSSLQTVLWPDSGWAPVSVGDMLEPVQVKKVWMRANLLVHPDKVRQRNGTAEQVAIADMVFDVLKDTYNTFR